jgi:UDP-N-acetylglucosamine:LPS N-acetylglucosamine transferase
MVSKDAAICIQQKDLTPERIAVLLEKYQKDPDLRIKMANSAYALRKTEVSKKIFDILSEVVN